MTTLQAGLTSRQLTMIGIGGVLGAGLFVGSGSVISATGPGTVLVYVAVGGLIVLVMRMLAELAVASPDTGSFSAYATRELGPWAGLAVGWLYAYHWWIVIAFEAIAGAGIAHQLLPDLPTWLAALVCMATLTGVNLTSVRNFGRIEFWLAMVKVAAIVAFIAIGAAALTGVLPTVDPPGLSNLTGHGGLFPHGAAPLLPALLTVFFSYFGTEMVTIAAGESDDPATAVRRSMRSVAWRIVVFYVGSMAIIVTLLPSDSAQIAASPYAAVLDRLGIPGAATVMNAVVLLAVLSCLNSGLYASSRMVYALARRGEAPGGLGRTTSAGVPARAVLLSAGAGFTAVFANYFLPTDVVFTFLANSSGAVAVVVYLCVAATQIAGRIRHSRENNTDLPLRMWGFPYLSIFVVIALATVILGMACTSGSRTPLVLTTATTIAACIAGLLHQRKISPRLRAGERNARDCRTGLRQP